MENSPSTPPETAPSKIAKTLSPAIRREAITTYTRLIKVLNQAVSPAAAQIMAECLTDHISSSGGNLAGEIELLQRCTQILSAPDMCRDVIDEETQVDIVREATKRLQDGNNTMERFVDCIADARKRLVEVPIF